MDTVFIFEGFFESTCTKMVELAPTRTPHISTRTGAQSRISCGVRVGPNSLLLVQVGIYLMPKMKSAYKITYLTPKPATDPTHVWENVS